MIDIKIDQLTLNKCLSYLKSTVGANVQNGEDCIQMSYDNKTGSLIMATTNGIEFATVSAICVSNNTMDSVAPYVEFKRFYGIVSSIPGNTDIYIKENNNGNLEIQAAGRNIELSAKNVTPLQMPVVTGTTWAVPTTKLNRAMKCANIITSDKQAAFTNPIYGCVRIESFNTRIEFSKVDYMTKRMFARTIETSTPNANGVALIEGAKYSKIEQMFEDAADVDIVMDNSNVKISRGISLQNQSNPNITNATYVCRRLNGNYPNNISTSLNSGMGNSFKFTIDDVETLVKSMKAIEDNSSANSAEYVNISIDDDTMNLKYSSQHGNVEGNVISTDKSVGKVKASFKLKDIKDVIASAKITGATEMTMGVLKGHNNYFVMRHDGINIAQGETLPTFSIPAFTKSTP